VLRCLSFDIKPQQLSYCRETARRSKLSRNLFTHKN